MTKKSGHQAFPLDQRLVLTGSLSVAVMNVFMQDRNWADEMENLDSCGPQNLQLQQPGDHGYQKV